MQTKQFLITFSALVSVLIFVVAGAILLLNSNSQTDVTDMEGMMGGTSSDNSWVISVVLFILAFVIAISLILYFVFLTKGQNSEQYRANDEKSMFTQENKITESHVSSQQIKTPRIEGRVGTGNKELDNLLFGGIPPKMAVALTMPISDEGNALIKRFIETGAKNNDITFYVTSDPVHAIDLSRKFSSNFYLFVTNPRLNELADLGSNASVLGIGNLTDINIALTKAFRNLDLTNKGPRRICLNVISDILLEHGPVRTRKWLSELLSLLYAEGFTVLAVINPKMHSSEDVQAILGLFDGEINIRERETVKELRRFIKIKRMANQKYLKNEIVLTED